VLLVPHQETKEPLPKEEMAVIWENCKDYGLLTGTGGAGRGAGRNVSPHNMTG